jgi:hypothetical protein
MAKVGKVYWHGRCVLSEAGIEGLMKLQKNELDKLTLGDIGVEAMRAILKGSIND